MTPGALRWLAVATLAAVVGGTALAAAAVWDRGWQSARAEAVAEASRTAIDLRTAVADVLLAVDTGVPNRRDVTIGRLDAGGGGGDDTVDPVVLRSAAVRTALARARDSGSVVVAGPTSEGVVVVVRAVYRSSAEPAGPPVSVAQRRSAVAGYTIGVVAASSLLPEDVVGSRRITDGQTELVSFADPPGEAATASVPVLDRRWGVAAPVVRPSPAAVWAIVALGAAVAAAVVATGRWSSRMVRRGGEDADLAQARADAVVTYARVVQESHDLGEVVPALAVQLADRLGLAGLSLSVAADGGRHRDLFAHGDPPDDAITASSSLPTAADAGETLAVHLRRAERSIGVLRVRCGRGLDAADIDQLRIAAELMTSTVVTARSLEQQQEAVQRLGVLDEMKTAFLGTASHELRTPVTAIAGFSAMLSTRWDSLSESDRRVFAERIASNSRTLEALVQDLLDFARLERGETRLVLEVVDVAVVAGRVVDRLAPAWSSHTFDRTLGPGCWVEADVGALERVVTNLLSNAVKFSPAGSTIRIAVVGGDEVRLVVDDEGPGVPAAERERIFVRFLRGQGEAVLRTSGVGIGLSVVKDFVGRMRGQIVVGDNPRGGARFEVRFPPAAAGSEQEEHHAAST